MGRSTEQASRNEVTFREANERIRAARDRLREATDPVPFLCECEDAECTAIVRVPLAVYADVRSHGSRFLPAAGHPTRGDVVDRRDGFDVVEKA